MPRDDHTNGRLPIDTRRRQHVRECERCVLDRRRRRVAACAALTLSSFSGRVAVACDALCRVDAARLNDAKEALTNLAALAPKSGEASQEPFTLAVGDLGVAYDNGTVKGSLTAAYAHNKIDAHLQTTDATHGALMLAAHHQSASADNGVLTAEAAPVDLKAGAVACRFGKINLRRDGRGTALIGRSMSGGTATCQARLAADDGNPARPTAALAWASDSGWDAVLVADVPLKADPLDVQLRTLQRATVSIDVGGTAVDIRDASLAWEAGALKINDAAVSVGATSFTTSVQIDASIPGSPSTRLYNTSCRPTSRKQSRVWYLFSWRAVVQKSAAPRLTERGRVPDAR